MAGSRAAAVSAPNEDEASDSSEEEEEESEDDENEAPAPHEVAFSDEHFRRGCFCILGAEGVREAEAAIASEQGVSEDSDAEQPCEPCPQPGILRVESLQSFRTVMDL